MSNRLDSTGPSLSRFSPPPEPEEFEPLITAEEAAQLMKVPITWIYRHVHGPDALPHFRLGRYVRFRESELVTWIERRARKR
jgi:excisionase family DNA binding protein